jgi:hypothetical protein
MLITGVLASTLLLPAFVWYTVREMRLAERTAHDSEERARQAEERLKVTEARREKAEKELARTDAALEQTRLAFVEAERRLATAQETFEKFRHQLLSKADFLKTGLGIQTAAERSHDVAVDLRRLRDAKAWEQAVKLAMGWLEFHKGSPTTADRSALLEVALLWRRYADLAPKLWPLTPFKTKREFLVEANNLFEEAEGKADTAQPKGFVAGNWGTVLRDLANSNREDPDVARYRRNAVRLLDLAGQEPKAEKAWHLNRLYLELDLRSQDPAGFAAYCDGLPNFRTVSMECGRGLYTLVRRTGVIAESERERLMCKAAKWARHESPMQEECEKARRRSRRP